MCFMCRMLGEILATYLSTHATNK
uniref:Uncharacterized protein n=1 Tax=Arundo donax TaxID=35708 RepID=A0A0A8YGQ3_ARUDO